MMLVFLLEELSMKVFLEGLLPRILPVEVEYRLIPHEGKTDLEKSIPRKLRAWRDPNTYFVVLRDQDQGDCLAVKEKLAGLCDSAGRSDALVRIACRELEAWILGDLKAVGDAFGLPRLGQQQVKAKFRNPDQLGNPSEEITKLVKNYQKVSGARAVGQHLDAARCCSPSFGAFVVGVDRLVAAF